MRIGEERGEVVQRVGRYMKVRENKGHCPSGYKPVNVKLQIKPEHG